MQQVAYGHSATSYLLQNINLDIHHSECHCIHGATGVGKSTLLALMAGVQSRPVSGDLRIKEGLKVGLVTQDPNAQLLRGYVGAEVAFALENLGVASDAMPDLVQKALCRVGLFVSLNTKVDQLSLGQKYRLMLAAQLVYEPEILLLDEPWGQLDDIGVEELSNVLAELLEQGLCIVMVEHNSEPFANLISHYWDLERTGLVKRAPSKRPLVTFTLPTSIPCADEVLNIQPFCFKFKGRSELYRSEQALKLTQGQLAVLQGDNGVGKSSLLKVLAGMRLDLEEVPARILGKKPKLGRFGADLGLLLQSPNQQLFELTVQQELEFSLDRYQRPLIWAAEVLELLGLTHLASLSPHTLSYGQQHLIALASVACYRPKLLLLDDPFAGLDEHYCEKVWSLLLDLLKQGTAIVLACHRCEVLVHNSLYWKISEHQLTVENRLDFPTSVPLDHKEVLACVE